MITGNMSLADVVRDFPGATAIFNQYQVDYCCGGKDSLEAALKERGLPVDSFVRILNDEAEKAARNAIPDDLEALYALDTPTLIRHIDDRHHGKDRNLLYELDELVNTILVVHFDDHHGELIPLHRLFADLKKELEEHFVREEKVVFPAMIRSARTGKAEAGVREEIARLEEEHVAAGHLIKEIQEVTRNFTPPAGVCTTYMVTYRKLQELVEDIFMHIYKENAVLFPVFARDVQ